MYKKMHVSCPACGEDNLIDREQKWDKVCCSSCEQALFTGSLLSLNAENIGSHLESDLPLIVAFSTPWYPASYGLGSIYRQAARLLEPHMRLAQIDSAACPELAQQFRVHNTPTTIALRHGRELGRILGLLSLPQFVHWTQQLAL